MTAELAEIIFYAIIAIAVFLRLHNVLGRVDNDSAGSEQNTNIDTEDIKIVNIKSEEFTSPNTMEDILSIISATNNQEIADKLKKISDIDNTFVAVDFVRRAEMAYEKIISLFTIGDTKELKELVTNNVLEKFSKMIEERNLKKEKQETTIISIDQCKITDVVFDKKNINISLIIDSTQNIIVRDLNGNLKYGDTSKFQKMKDRFTFTKQIGSNSPVWLLSSIQ